MRFEKITIPPSFYSLILLWVDSSLRCYEMRAFQHIILCSILLLVCKNWMRGNGWNGWAWRCIMMHAFPPIPQILTHSPSSYLFLSFLEPIFYFRSHIVVVVGLRTSPFFFWFVQRFHSLPLSMTSGTSGLRGEHKYDGKAGFYIPLTC